MSPITTHILDTALGRPAAGVGVQLEAKVDGAWQHVGAGETDDDGRNKSLMPAGELKAGTYRITFDTLGYYQGLGEKSFYPEVRISFVVESIEQHYHVPLLLSPFGYSTYRGS